MTPEPWGNGVVELRQGDVRAVLAAIEPESVHMVVTSPPYWGLRDYGLEPSVWGGNAECEHEWGSEQPHGRRGNRGISGTGGNLNPALDATGNGAGSGTAGSFCRRCAAWRGCLGLEPTPELFVDHLVEVFRAVRRVLRKDGVLFLNLGDSYWGGKGQSNYGFQERRKSISLESDHHNIAGMGETRPQDGRHAVLKPKDLVMMPARVALALQADGWWLRSDIIWAKPNPMPESVTDRPTTSHEHLFLLTKAATYFYDAESIREPASENRPWAQSSNGGQKQARLGHNSGGRLGAPAQAAGRNRRSVWTVATQPYPEAHFATFPEALVEPCILAGTSERGVCAECGAPWARTVEKSRSFESGSGRSGNMPVGKNGANLQGGGETLDVRRGPVVTTETTGWAPGCAHEAGVVPATVLDPFAGSGTTLAVAQRLGRRAVGIDLSGDYLKLARRRLEAVPLPLL